MLGLGAVVVGRSGKRFAVAEASALGGVRFWSIENSVLLNGSYSLARLMTLFETGALRETGETFDVYEAMAEASERAASRRTAGDPAKADAALAGSRQIVRMLGSKAAPSVERDAKEATPKVPPKKARRKR